MAEKVAWTMKGRKMIFKTSVWKTSVWKEVNLCIGALERRAQVPECILWRVALILEALTEKEARDDDALFEPRCWLLEKTKIPYVMFWFG
jgi:hypothetical protein